MYGMTPDTLQRLYVQGSLKNQDSGFSFQIKNLIDSGSVSGIVKLTVDGEARPLDGVTVELGGKIRPVTSLSWASSVYVSYGAVLTLFVPGPLEPGDHIIAVTVSAPELGQITLPVKGTIA